MLLDIFPLQVKLSYHGYVFGFSTMEKYLVATFCCKFNELRIIDSIVILKSGLWWKHYETIHCG